MVIGGQRVQTNEKFWTNVQELSGTVHLYGLLTTLLLGDTLELGLVHKFHVKFKKC